MRKPVRVAAVCTAAVVVLSIAPAATADDGPDHGREELPAAQALERATRLLRPTAFARMVPHFGRLDATLVLRDLYANLAELPEDDQNLASMMLARPTDRYDDPSGYGYRTRKVARKCERTVCVHWARTTADRPPHRAWALRSLRTLQKVYDFEVDTLGYRPPAGDGKLGGNRKLDVYLKDLGAGLYGYCAPEYYKPGSKKVASAYCVIDNDFSRRQFVGDPRTNLKVTLAHEFFHAVQFAHDITDDRWLYESTAVWIEDLYADDANDNRQYLPLGQVRRPQVSLDLFDDSGTAYGNWAFWEFLSKRFGPKIVRKVWRKMDAGDGGPDMFSTRAVRKVLDKHGGFENVYAAFAAANVTPDRSYPEGAKWPQAKPTRTMALSPDRSAWRARLQVDHMASRTVRLKPDGVRRGSHLQLDVTVPRHPATSRVKLVIRRPGGAAMRRSVPLDEVGRGSARLAFGSDRVRDLSVVLVNASTRFDCWDGTSWSCRGVARHDNLEFAVAARLVR